MSIHKHRGSTLDSFLEQEGGTVSAAKLTVRGGVIIPKAMREKHGWSAGTKLKLSEDNGIVLLVKVGKQDD